METDTSIKDSMTHCDYRVRFVAMIKTCSSSSAIPCLVYCMLGSTAVRAVSVHCLSGRSWETSWNILTTAFVFTYKQFTQEQQYSNALG